MTSSGTYTFGVNTNTTDILTEGFERIGREASTLSANDMDSARRSMSYLFMDWNNKGPNLWAWETQTIPLLTDGTATYNLDQKTINVFFAVTRQTFGTQVTDLSLGVMSETEYASIPNKDLQSARPTQYLVNRLINPSVTIWPVLQPGSVCSLIIYRMRAIQDVGTFTNTPDFPQRWVEACAAGLAYKLAQKPDMRGDKFDLASDMPRLQQSAMDSFTAATGEDVQKRVPLRIAPRGYSMNGGWR